MSLELFHTHYPLPIPAAAGKRGMYHSPFTALGCLLFGSLPSESSVAELNEIIPANNAG